MSYRSAHKAVARAKGKASLRLCVDCRGPASDWSYDHRDPAQIVDQWHGRDVAYSANPVHYVPRCARCHRLFDRLQLEPIAVQLTLFGIETPAQ